MWNLKKIFEKQIWLRIIELLWAFFSCPAWIYFFWLRLALLGQCCWITEITRSNSCLQLNYAETRLSQLENCHCEKTCQVSGLLYRDQDSWVDGDHCRNCTCKVSLFVPKWTVLRGQLYKLLCNLFLYNSDSKKYCLFTKCLFSNWRNCEGKLEKCHYKCKFLSRESRF